MSPGHERDRPSGDDKRYHRRGFFTEGLREFFRPVARAAADHLEERLRRAGVRPEDDEPRAGPKGGPPSWVPTVDVPRDRPVLRPPGALAEEEFLDRCLSSGQCVSVCPVNAIQLARSDDPRLDEKPFIDAESQACVVCQDLSCMNVCPSGALQPVPAEAIDMGVAVVNDDVCVRTSGEDCQICVDKCPIGPRAIEIPYEGGTVQVHDEGCTGCGVCQMYCPTDPRAIVVVPARDAPGPGPQLDPRSDGSYFPLGSPDLDEQD